MLKFENILPLHWCIYTYVPTEEGLNVLIFDGTGCKITDYLSKAFDTHAARQTPAKR